MKKIILYIAASLNGKIAQSDGDVEWLETIPNPEQTDYGYQEFYDSVGTTIQGYNTYQKILDWGIEFPYPTTKNYVLTRRQGLADTAHVEFISNNHLEFIEQLKTQEGKDIWLIGGGQINTLLFNAGLIDEIRLFVMPIILSSGIELFEQVPQQKKLTLMTVKEYRSGVLELRYAV